MPEQTATQSVSPRARRAINRVPVSTYRLQLGPELTLDHICELLPYLTQLGISDIYLSPLFRARAESSHGYDVVDHGTIDPAIGDLQSFSRLSEAARLHGMGILLDVVPNHMGINDPGNVWWLDVLENGEGSNFAEFFDIEWHPPADALADKVLLPFLAEPFGKVLERGELRIVYRGWRLQLEYKSRLFPLAPPTWPVVLQLALAENTPANDGTSLNKAERDELASIITQLSNLPVGDRRDVESLEVRYREQGIANRRLEQLVAESAAVRAALDAAIEQINGESGNPKSFDRLEELLDAQWYRLAFWRVAADEINYRRFFDVNDLAAIRVEDPRVFDAVHRLVARLLEAGWVTGLRIDHPDGLRDPLEYFKELQTLYRSTQPTSGGDAPELYVLAEKILSGDEHLSTDWSVCGTTGYDLLNSIGRLQVDGDGLAELRAGYQEFTGRLFRPSEVMYEGRRAVLESTMASELQMLSAQLYRIARQHRASRDFTQPALLQALREVLASMNVYRTYARADSWDINEVDYRTITIAVRMAKRRNRTMPFAVLDFLASVLLLEHPPTLTLEQAEERRQFALKFQQVSGPVAAKGVEDTAFYRYYPLASLNEVGGELDARSLVVDEFHRQMRQRSEVWPHSMNATSTHDSKRGEDFRARLHVLSEISAEWRQVCSRWRQLNVPACTEFDGEPVPDANELYFIYQTLVGTWLVDVEASSDLDQYRDRIRGYLVKALREAKIHTSWMSPAETYEAAIDEFIVMLFAAEQQPFRDDLASFARSIADAGFVNALAQVLLKITLPGMPDFYRGTELWDFNLVDPDNRRPVDFEYRKRRLAELWTAANSDRAALVRELADRWPNDDLKLWVTTSALSLRREWSEVFATGDYIPLTATGPAADYIVAFARRSGQKTALCVVPRHYQRLRSERPAVKHKFGAPHADWTDTNIILPTDFATEWTSQLSGVKHTTADNSISNDVFMLAAAELFAVLPVTLLTSETN